MLLQQSSTSSTGQHTQDKTRQKQDNFLLCCLRHFLDINWRDKVWNIQVLASTGLPTIYTLPRQHRLCWLGRVCRMEDGQMLKDTMYGELACGKRPLGRPQLCYKDICNYDMKSLNINTGSWEDATADHKRWQNVFQKQLKAGEKGILKLAEEKRASQKARSHGGQWTTIHICTRCSRDCHSRIGLISHSKCCTSWGCTTNQK